MKRLLLTVLPLVLLAGILPIFAQQTKTPFPVILEKQLAARATNYTEVSLDKNMLAFAGRFMNGKDADEAHAKKLIQNLTGIWVRTYEFDKSNQYTHDDLESIRKQFDGTEWSALVRERSKNGGDDTDVYMKTVNGEIQGMFVLDAEEKELSLVYIDGPIRPEELSELGGSFGIPKSTMNHVAKGEGK
jgi:Domain of unknown function (DUF4252)